VSSLPPPGSPSPRKRIEHAVEAAIFNSRWLLAPFYLGLVISLLVLLLKFLRILYDFVRTPVALVSPISFSAYCRLST
jgi:uncharacterized membrane protein YqhA